MKSEIIDWSVATLFGTVNFLYLEHAEPWRSSSCMPAKFKNYTNRVTVPSSFQVIGSAGLISTLYFLPNKTDESHLIRYQHIKTMIQVNGAYLPFLTSIAKLSCGKKRPDYEDRVKLGLDTKEGRRAFWSGHASSSMSVVTYFNLYLHKYIDTEDSKSRYWKYPLSMALYGIAGYIGWSRIHDHLHDETDVVVGSIVGIATGWLSFNLTEKKLEKKNRGILSKSNFSISGTPQSLILHFVRQF